jgi:hypothetical protein
VPSSLTRVIEEAGILVDLPYEGGEEFGSIVDS